MAIAHGELGQVVSTFSGPIAAFITLVVVLFLRRLLPTDKRGRGKVTLVCLLISLILHLVALTTGEMGFGVATGAVSFIAVVLQSFAMTGVVRMLVFDLALSAVRVRVPVTLQDIIQAVSFAVIFFSIMRARGVNVLSLITTSAVLTAVIGLALQSTIANLFAGLSLQLDRTIAVGDWIKVADREARIADIKWRSTFLVTREGDTLILPNGELLRGAILNYSKPTGAHRARVKVGFHYRHPPNDVKKTMVGALTGVEGVRSEPPPSCVPVEFGESALVYEVRFWIDDASREDVIGGDVITRIWYAAQRSGIEIPFPIRTVQMTQVTQETVTREHELEFLQRTAALARVDLFRGLEESDREILARGMKRVAFAGGESIIRQGEPGDTLFFINDGEVAVRLNVEGVEREVAVLKPGQFFGEMSLMTGEPRAATCKARSDVELYEIGHLPVKQLLGEKPKLAEDVAQILATRQASLGGEREGLSAEARARRAAEHSSRVLAKIRDFFRLG